MVENRLDTIFHALADPTRRGMLASLALGEKSIGELGEPFRMTFAGASKHVKVLESAGLIERRRDGRKQICTLKPGPPEEAERWLRHWEKFWNARSIASRPSSNMTKRRRIKMTNAATAMRLPVEKTAPDTIRLERTLDAPVEKVWRYLTEAHLRSQWFMGGTDAKPNGEFELLVDHDKLSDDDNVAYPE